jgi:hypothetical protein
MIDGGIVTIDGGGANIDNGIVMIDGGIVTIDSGLEKLYVSHRGAGHQINLRIGRFVNVQMNPYISIFPPFDKLRASYLHILTFSHLHISISFVSVRCTLAKKLVSQFL